jgi:hypothetical protein
MDLIISNVSLSGKRIQKLFLELFIEVNSFLDAFEKISKIYRRLREGLINLQITFQN